MTMGHANTDHSGKTKAPRGMRRAEREITLRSEIDDILRSDKVMHLALCDQDRPFLVPVFYAYDGQSIYFHSAKSGSKITIMKRNPQVCFEITTSHGVIESKVACDFEAQHRTVIGTGEVEFISDSAQKIGALNLIVAQFSDQTFIYPEAALQMTEVIRINIQSIRGKKHGF